MKLNYCTGFGNTGSQRYRVFKIEKMNVSDFPILNNLYVPASTKTDVLFEKNYIDVRSKENRIYSDEQLRQLPAIAKDHPHYKEWAIRKKSCERLISYLESKKNILNILEIGCGNGWMSYQLSRIPGCRVIGLDINLTELQQAARVFDKNSKLKFVYADIRSDILSELKFDIIVFAASIQYFSPLQEILDVALRQLYREGEIHIIDSHFYKPDEIGAAKERTRKYYESLGLPGMANYYYHHSIAELKPYNHQILRDPRSIKNKLFDDNPFFWINVSNGQ